MIDSVKWMPSDPDEALMLDLSNNPLVRSYLEQRAIPDDKITIDVTDLTITIIKDSNNAMYDFLHSARAEYLFKLWNFPLKLKEEKKNED